MSLGSYVDSPLFTTGNEVSATDINILRSNAMILQGISRRSAPIHCIDTALTGFFLGQTVWRGGFLYRVGMTTATIQLIASLVGSPGATPQFKIYFNGAEVHTRNLATEDATINITISGLGYTDYQVITVECKLTGNPDTGSGGYDATLDTFYINTAYVHTLTPILGSYAGTTTFGDISATNLNNLSNSLDWLADRLSIVPYVPIMSLRQWQGTHRIELIRMWRGVIYVDSINPKLYVDIDFTSRAVASYVKIRVYNGVSTYTDFDYGPYTTNQTVTINADINVVTQAGCAPGFQFWIDIFENQTEVDPDWRLRQNSRFTLRAIRMGNSSYTYTAPPTESQMLESMTFSTLQGRLNTIKTITDEVNTRVTDAGNAIIFNRAQMFRGRYGNDTFQDEYWQDEWVVRAKRTGDVLWVKGQGLSIGYGGVTTTTKGDNEKYEYSYQYGESLTAGDKVETKFFYMNQFEGLYYGSEYFIYGKDIIFVSEYLR